MLATVYTCAVVGLDGVLVEAEVDVGAGKVGMTIVGLPDTAVQESRERVRAAIRNSGTTFPLRRITVNLAPADIRKEGPAYDLPIALGILCASGQVFADLTDTVAIGELSLDGSLRHTNGILPMAGLAREKGYRRVLVPTDNAAEAALIEGLEVIPAGSLAELVRHLTGEQPIAPFDYVEPDPQLTDVAHSTDLQHIRGQEHVKRGLEVAAAGAHNLLMFGSHRLQHRH
jgi:magnesium chelatase family protein